MSKFQSNENKKVVGKFKDEACGEIITEFVGLRPKMYSYTKENGGGDKKAKGVKKDVIKKNITHSDYVRVLEDYNDMNLIRSNKHQIGSYTMHKVSLSCHDNKRYILDDGINTRAHGHYMNRIQEKP